MVDDGSVNRRPVAARKARWAGATANWLARQGVRPNQVSIASFGSAVAASACLVLSGRVAPGWRIGLLIAAAGLIELRLLCNLLDGMIAIEGGKGSKSGPVFNELPDRFSDTLILIAAGYAVGSGWGSVLGWCAALLAVLTACVRAFAGSLGARQDFGGPMAKQRRMEVIAAGCLLGAVFAFAGWNARLIAVALVVVVAGNALTIARRTLHLVQELESE